MLGIASPSPHGIQTWRSTVQGPRGMCLSARTCRQRQAGASGLWSGSPPSTPQTEKATWYPDNGYFHVWSQWLHKLSQGKPGYDTFILVEEVLQSHLPFDSTLRIYNPGSAGTLLHGHTAWSKIIRAFSWQQHEWALTERAGL